ncbi:E3 ubiquitin-protein ligase RNF34-like [Zootermopsis nevadensis]|uniref:E3 ubiquitin-protein ligase RNF34-like n=1 Tax=Zootermopsis nevadensis TaxID=136037 RepID=UPI000B8E323A|nr:E3 ubiquitin-protein ligase RNF34-like [Zootermopsis nevadensis]
MHEEEEEEEEDDDDDDDDDDDEEGLAGGEFHNGKYRVRYAKGWRFSMSVVSAKIHRTLWNFRRYSCIFTSSESVIKNGLKYRNHLHRS